MEPVIIKFLPALEDFTSANKELDVARKKKPSQWILIFFGLLCLITFLEILIPSGQFSSIEPIVFGLIKGWIIVIAVFICYLIINGAIINKPNWLPASQSNSVKFSPTTIELNDDGYRTNSTSSESRSYWHGLVAFIETQNFIILKFAGQIGIYSFIPKRAFTSKEQEQYALSFLASKMQGRVNDTEHF
jgi:hypothetical protein